VQQHCVSASRIHYSRSLQLICSKLILIYTLVHYMCIVLQDCLAGSYLTAPCTDLCDAVCSTCTVACAAGHYMLASCTAVSDLTCARCTDCLVDSWAAGGCSGATDRVCKQCKQCSQQPQGTVPPQYQLTPCLADKVHTLDAYRMCAYTCMQGQLQLLLL
jgi:hypothetical protein